MNSAPAIFIFFALAAVAAALLGVFVILKNVLIFVYQLITGLFKSTRAAFTLFHPNPNALPGAKPCPRWNCQCQNPAHAKFCRRCGHEM